MSSAAGIVTQVPFDFIVANKHVPAGECIVRSASMGVNALVVRNVAAKVSLFSSAIPAETKKASSVYALVFHKYGNQHFLAGIKLAGSKTTYRLPQSKAEAEILAQNVPATEEILFASLK
jgi:hypothetical protein